MPLLTETGHPPWMGQGHPQKAPQQKEWQRQGYESRKQFLRHLTRSRDWLAPFQAAPTERQAEPHQSQLDEG